MTTRWLNDEQQRAWRAWLDLNAQLSARLHRHLKATSGLSLADYDVLVALTDVPEHRLRMFALGEQLQWEKSRVSKQVARMETRGLVVREECDDDGRGIHVALTDEGLEAIRSAAPAHVELVQQLVFDGLDADQVRELGTVTTTILDRVRQDGSTNGEAEHAKG